jgi:hypothetical protein
VASQHNIALLPASGAVHFLLAKNVLKPYVKCIHVQIQLLLLTHAFSFTTNGTRYHKNAGRAGGGKGLHAMSLNASSSDWPFLHPNDGHLSGSTSR